jgi:pantothenate kinase-related protein Tda10
MKPTSGASKIPLLIGISGARAKGQTTLASVSKHLLQLLVKPQLLLPSKSYPDKSMSSSK